ncbi:uncharacterized protein PV09_06712 [Verruconis gallopava]|uniref:CSC1/OSCA1-like 7TM region domain-containing protein n=1 Tax=Verruconis gallopava TaxID=253628 RepID=A0A0D2A520_9PEZI|nr:uncharacterized protein PV09_06712 [Verruconis gallopava]KIW01863.1 hypothetical protein PV09_06712 [Verruconis gallopava]
MEAVHLHLAFEEAAKYFVRRQAVSQNNDSNIGSSQSSSKNSNSASSLLSTLVPVLLVAAVWLGIFLVIRPRAAWKYAPRTRSKTLQKGDYSPELSSGLFSWISELWKIPDTFVLQHQSIDAYLFLRFMKIEVVTCLVGCLITMPVLFPVNATGGAGQHQLDILSMSNVENSWRFFAHAGCAWIFFGFVMFMIARESIFYINLRQAYLLSPLYSRKLSSRTVLFTSVPDDYLDEKRLRDMLGGAVRHIWFPTDTKELDDLVGERDKVAFKLEGAETKLIKTAWKNKSKLDKAAAKKGEAAPASAVAESGDAEATTTGSIAARWVSPKDRPTHRLKFLIGKKVDTISWSREELERQIPKIQEEQQKHRDAAEGVSKVRAVFVEFDSLREAQAAYQSLTHHRVMMMAPRYTGIHPLDVIWSNLHIKGYERFIRYSATLAVVVALIIFWSIPVAFVGAISNLNYLTNINAFKWLRFINHIPSVILGVVTGLLPVVLLSLLMSLLPPFLRWMARLGGAPTYSDAEYTLQNYYFAFQVVQVFLVATLGSAASSVVTQIINDPTIVTSLLSTSLPKASNFYLSYIVLQGLGVFASMLVGLAGLIVTPILVKILGSTPRKIFLRWNRLAGVGWGQVFPIMTNFLVIAICYSCIAPLVLIFAAIGIFFFYFAYRYNFLYVYNTGVDTRGAVYPRALQHLFVGLYIAEICLLGLFATRLNSKGAIGPFVLMILLLIFTALFHVGLNSALEPLIKFLPKSLEAEERLSLLQVEEGQTTVPRDGEAEKADVEAHNGVKNGAAVVDGPAPHKKPNMITKFLKPHIYNDYHTMRRLVPDMIPEDDEFDEGMVRDAYLPPSVWSDVPILVIPKDPLGISAQEIQQTPRVIPITDEAATLNEQGKIIVDDEKMGEIYFSDKTNMFADKY